MRNNILIICGPTASGKSKLAIEVAKKYNGAIINADSMQAYKGLEILTSSPSLVDKKSISHHLYNYLELDDLSSVARYQKEALDVIDQVRDLGYLPIIVGGTGLYINALIKGINVIPDVDVQIRIEAQGLLEKIGKEEFFQTLIAMDPLVSDKINISDKQRMLRAYEVIKQTGKSIRYFQSQETESPLAGYKISTIMLSPTREFLYKSCNDRFIHMICSGAMSEVKNLYMNGNAIRVHPLGFKELASCCQGTISLENAITLAQNRTRQYAKRQVTWFNNQLKEKSVIEFSSEEEYDDMLRNIALVISR